MKTALALAVVLTAGNVSAGIFDGCNNSEARTVAAPAAGISKVFIEGKAGSLKVIGRAGATEIRAMGTACSSDRDFLESMRLTSRRDGSELHTSRPRYPDTKSTRASSAPRSTSK
jgi:hypothetical protein